MSCRGCGQVRALCCRHLKIPVTPADHARMGFLFSDSVMPMVKGTCIFLGPDESCTIYATRPQACRDQQTDVCLSGGLG